MTFKDLFSVQSASYAKYRPDYPPALYAWLASQTPGHAQAWDCGTGNGQCAVHLAGFYENVYATDPSAQQIAHAAPHDHVRYAVEPAENCGLPDASADLVTVGQALHWFRFEDYFREVARVLRPGGLFAAWTYGLPEISPEIDALLLQLHEGPLGSYWLPENRMIEKGYADIPFPFPLIAAPEFYVEKYFSRSDLFGLFDTWSATQRYIADHNRHPAEDIATPLMAVWSENEVKTLRWKLVVKAGRPHEAPNLRR
ncbi:class I SAM-dependent methyltransferase [Chitinophaga caseinilytica]|uniref:class I SAM-dependent methyltransferase n=1 Tax=Chitinophaga caseinilytica TaxID=2267521 RepID=UPI003C2CF62B